MHVHRTAYFFLRAVSQQTHCTCAGSASIAALLSGLSPIAIENNQEQFDSLTARLNGHFTNPGRDDELELYYQKLYQPVTDAHLAHLFVHESLARASSNLCGLVHRAHCLAEPRAAMYRRVSMRALVANMWEKASFADSQDKVCASLKSLGALWKPVWCLYDFRHRRVRRGRGRPDKAN
jgi:hypothetical protein